VLADRGVNLTELSTHSRPGPGGAPRYGFRVSAEVPDTADVPALRASLEREGDRLVIDVALLPSTA
jgi:glycine cleavage system regulatory protein